MDFAEHADLTGRLRGLVILLGERLSADQARFADELVDASEFGVALETLAGWLSEEETPIPDDVRHDFPWGIHRFAQVPTSTWTTGDVFARAYVRWLEIRHSVAFIRGQLDAFPDGPIRARQTPR